MTNRTDKGKNKEVKVVGTHAAGATDLFETRHSSEEIAVDPPKHPGGSGSSGTY